MKFHHLILLVLLATCDSLASPVYPLKMSGNKRYLVDSNNTPFLLKGDSPQGAFLALTSAQFVSFAHNRATNGLNALWIQLMSDTSMGGQGNFSLKDGILPWTGAEWTTPNEAYFFYIDACLTVCATNGLVVFLNPAEWIGMQTKVRAATTNDLIRLASILAVVTRTPRTSSGSWGTIFKRGQRGPTIPDCSPLLMESASRTLMETTRLETEIGCWFWNMICPVFPAP